MKKILFLSFTSVLLLGMENSEENKTKRRPFADKKLVSFSSTKNLDTSFLKEKFENIYIGSTVVKIVEDYRSQNPVSDIAKK